MVLPIAQFVHQRVVHVVRGDAFRGAFKTHLPEALFAEPCIDQGSEGLFFGHCIACHFPDDLPSTKLDDLEWSITKQEYIYFASIESPNSRIFNTVFQLRPVFTTPIHLSNFSAILLVPKPSGVWI